MNSKLVGIDHLVDPAHHLGDGSEPSKPAMLRPRRRAEILPAAPVSVLKPNFRQ